MREDTINVLLIDDDLADATLTLSALKKYDYSKIFPQHAVNLTDAICCLRSTSFDLILLDLGLPECVGIETLSRIRREIKDIPIIVLTGLSDEKTALESLEKGAQDYLCKNDVTSQTLSRSIRYAIQRHNLLGELRTANGLLTKKNQRLAKLYETAQQFVDNVSHEFRTPLTVIREYTSIIRDGLSGPLTESQTSQLDSILNRTDDLSLMVDDMLDISKLEAGLLSVWRRECSVKEIITNVQHLLRRKARIKGIDFTISVEPELPNVFCDEEKARRVLINLAVNAIKFTPAGENVEMWARLGESCSCVEVGVTDTGPGIHEENLNLIFERFKQFDTNIHSSTKGFGLGMNIAQELTRLNLGEMNVQSIVGQGSTFSFTVPKIDPQSLIEQYLNQILRSNDIPHHISLLLANVESNAKSNAHPVVDEFLQQFLRSRDLVYQIDTKQLLLVTVCPKNELKELLYRITNDWSNFSKNYPSETLPDITLQMIGSWDLQTQKADFVSAYYDSVSINDHHGITDFRKVLVADDDPELVQALMLRLGASGYETISASDGKIALEKAVSEKPDVIILDIRMPNLNGLEALQELKKNDITKNTPVVMLSASIRDQQKTLDHGASFFISKPYDSKDVLSAVEASLNTQTTNCKTLQMI